jgi:AraC-like DNA-binding protein
MRPVARLAVLHGYLELAASCGLDPVALLHREGLDPADLDAPDSWVPAVALARLLELSAVESGRDDFGILLAQRRRLSTVGPLSVVLREEPDLRSALGLLMRYEHSFNQAARLRLTETRGDATFTVAAEFGEPAPTRQALEWGVAALLGIIRLLRDPRWQPRAVCFEHRAPADLRSHLRLLGPRLRYAYGFTGLVFSARELAGPNVLAHPDDPLLRTYTRRFLRTLPPPPTSELVDQVRLVVEALLPIRRCTMTRVARGLGVTTRTLHRHLEAQGESFAGIVDRTRVSWAECRLAGDHYSITEISELLGFAAPSAFSRWFRRTFGTSPTAWRAAAHAQNSPETATPPGRRAPTASVGGWS